MKKIIVILFLAILCVGFTAYEETADDIRNFQYMHRVTSFAITKNLSKILFGTYPSDYENVNLFSYDCSSNSVDKFIKLNDDGINTITLSPDDSRFFIGNTSIIEFETMDLRELRQLETYLGAVYTVFYSADMKYILDIDSDWHDDNSFFEIRNYSDGSVIKKFEYYEFIAGINDDLNKIAVGYSLALFELPKTDEPTIIFDYKGISYPDDTSYISFKPRLSNDVYKNHFNPHYTAISFVNNDKGIVCASGRFLEYWDIAQKKRIINKDTEQFSIFSICANKKNSVFYTAEASNKIVMRNETTLEEVKSVVAHNDIIWSIKLSSDNRFLFSASNDGSLKIWNAVTLDLLLTYIPLNQSDYFIYTPDGFYDTTLTSDDLIKNYAYLNKHLKLNKNSLAKKLFKKNLIIEIIK